MNEQAQTGTFARSQARALYVGVVVFALLVSGGLRWAAMRNESLLADDWDHYAMYTGIYPVPTRAWDNFNFVGKGVHAQSALRASGRLPWWTTTQLQLAVFRPLSSLLVHLDFSVLDGAHHPLRLHLHSLVWWCALVLGVAVVLPALVPLPAAAVAIVLYAFDDAHVLPVSWAANRSELIATCFLVWALYARLRARRVGLQRLIAPGLVALGLSAGEHALPALAYFAAFELHGGRQDLRRGILHLLPIAALATGYLVLRQALGYGIAGSSFYIDPISDPRRYMTAAVVRVPLLVGDLLFGLPAEHWSWRTPWLSSSMVGRLLPGGWLTTSHERAVQLGLGYLALLLTVCAIFWMRRQPRSTHWRTCSWLLCASLCSLIPLSGTSAMSRLTLVPAIGFDAALGYALLRLYERVRADARTWQAVPAVLTAALVLQLQLVRAATRSYHEARLFSFVSAAEQRAVLDAEFGRENLAGRNVFLISARDLASQIALPYVLHQAGRALPVSSEVLSPAIDNAHLLLRVAPNILEIEYPEPLVGAPFRGNVYRSERETFHTGQRLAGPRFDVTILTMRDAEPRRLRFEFRNSLDDPRYVFMYPMKRGLVRVRFPPVGAGIRVPAPSVGAVAKKR